MKPPSPYKVVDTLLAARSQFAFSSNKLDDLGETLGLGRRVEHEGFELWRKCMNGEKKAWKDMLRYNEQDVVLLEAVYLRLLPYIKNHPNVNVIMDQTKCKCTACGSSKLHKRGYAYTNASKFQRFQCQDCGKWSRGRMNMLDKDYRKNIQQNIM